MPHNHASFPPCHGIIPARWGSTRFPGKPLADIQGKPMFWHVFNRALQCEKLESVTIATDDRRIADAAEAFNIPVVMTRSDHESGTDRVKEAADILQVPDNSVVVNIQGDEPLLDPVMLLELTGPFTNPGVMVTTLVHKLDETGADNPDRVKVVFAADGRALYFSRAAVPYFRSGEAGRSYHGHIGLYAFRKSVLDRFVALPPGRLEQFEKLEQLRLLENSFPIHVVCTESKSVSVDRPEDLDEVLKLLEAKRP